MSGPRILIVDDDPINIELAGYVLAADGFVVDSALDADGALAKMASFDPEIVLMDVQLPELDGLSLTRRFRSEPAMRDVVIVAFTAYAMKGDEQKMLAAGCDGYLPKPIDVSTFARTVRGYLRQRRP